MPLFLRKKQVREVKAAGGRRQMGRGVRRRGWFRRGRGRGRTGRERERAA
jgi:hypothetical protein